MNDAIRQYLVSTRKSALRLDRRHSYEISTYHHVAGETFVGLLSEGEKKQLLFPAPAYDQFRTAFVRFAKNPHLLANDSVPLPEHFPALPLFARLNAGDRPGIVVVDAEGTPHCLVPVDALPAFCQWMGDAKLELPQDGLERIVNYHSLFQLTFAEGGASIKSDLKYRADFLINDGDFEPKPVIGQDFAPPGLPGGEVPAAPSGSNEKSGKAGKPSVFRPKLGQRQIKVDYAIDYGRLKDSSASEVKGDADAIKPAEIRKSFSYRVPLSLHANEFKQGFRQTKQSEHGIDELTAVRDHFLGDRSASFYVGFEACEAVYRSHGRLKSLAFPLFYCKAAVRESNRSLYLDPLEHGKVYLNHLALIQVIERFTTDQNPQAAIRNFLRNLQSQEFGVGAVTSRVHVCRLLPVDEGCFRQVRTVLFGEPGDHGKGGLFAGTNLVGIEIDTENAFLYKNLIHVDISTRGIAGDLSLLLNRATHQPEAYRASLLAQFLAGDLPAIAAPKASRRDFHTHGYCSAHLGKVFKSLETSPIGVIEGPPGTGKSFTILNLIIDAICKNKRILVVSDKPGAIEAVKEKIEEYLAGPDGSSSDQRVKRLIAGSMLVCEDLAEQATDLACFANSLLTRLPEGLAETMDDLLKNPQPIRQSLQEIDHRHDDAKHMMDKIIGRRRAHEIPNFHATAGQQGIPTAAPDIDDLIALLTFMDSSFGDGKTQETAVHGWVFIKRMIEDRLRLRSLRLTSLLQSPAFSLHRLDAAQDTDRRRLLIQVRTFLLHVFEHNASDKKQIDIIAGAYQLGATAGELVNWLVLAGGAQSGALRRVMLKFKSRLREGISELTAIIDRQVQTLSLRDILPEGCWNQLHLAHETLAGSSVAGFPLALDLIYDKIIHNAMSAKGENALLPVPEIARILRKARKDQSTKDALTRELTATILARRAVINDTQETETTSAFTRLRFLLGQIKEQPDFNAASQLMEELRLGLRKAFPIVLCQKQVVSLLSPCEPALFDIAVVDEATQCRVDDSLPILYRAKRLVVVGDDRQTVLAKDSDIDDFLFSQFELDRRLIATQNTAVKGGGSNVFMLAKNVKQASVALVEHYRCPPAIIDFSNRYVYEGKLRVMQWERPGQAPSVVVNDSEKAFQGREQKAASGKYKGVETKMIDRFLDYLLEQVAKAEKKSGRRINLATDVAICTFLIKNRVYFDDAKAAFLARAKRGDDILIGAGAELQGKERDYIFYFWDIYPGNILAFKQGDDPDKRKGELNVLMSRPKLRAFHYLHRDFAKVRPGSADIVSYLSTHLEPATSPSSRPTDRAKDKVSFKKRLKRPDPALHPLNRGSGQLMYQLLAAKTQGKLKSRRLALTDLVEAQYSVAIGNPAYQVDLVLCPKTDRARQHKALGLIDLSRFQGKKRAADEIMDYAFQLERAKPGITPVFAYIHEIANGDTYVHYKVMQYLEKLLESLEARSQSAS